MTLAEYMNETGLNDGSMAELIGLKRPMVSLLRRGKANPSFRTIMAIERVTDGKVRASDFGEAA